MISIAELENLKKEALELKESQKGKITLEGKNKIILRPKNLVTPYR